MIDMKVRRFAALAAAAALALGLAEMAQAGATGDTSRPAEPSPAAAAVAPARVYDVWALREALHASNGDGFGGLYYDDQGALVLQATAGSVGPVTAAKTAYDARSGARAPASRVEIVEHALVQLRGVTEVLGRLAVDWNGGALVSYGIDDVTNSVRVGLAANSPAEQSALLSATGLTREILTFVQDAPVPPAFGREDDAAPWNAGNRIFNENSPRGGCTSGFGVHDSTNGRDYLLTAAHCSTIPGQADFFWNGSFGDMRRNPMGFSTGVNFGWKQWDTQLIRTESSTKTWTATDDRSQITQAFSTGPDDPAPLMNEGASSAGWQSGFLRTTRTSHCRMIGPYAVWGDVMICNLWEAVPRESDGCASKGGDSGGPIVWYSGYGPLAVGQIVAGNCDLVLFHAIGDMLAKDPHSGSGRLHINRVGDPG